MSNSNSTTVTTSVNEQQTASIPDNVNPVESLESNSSCPSNVSDHEFNSPPDNLETAVANCIAKCQTESITDPTEILMCASKYIVQGRALDISSSSHEIEGETSFIHIDREEILPSAFEEVRSLENPRLTLEVSFYGELASDLGGPRKEFFTLCMREIQRKYFANGLRDYMSGDYEIVGLLMGLSLLQNGHVPNFLTDEIIEETFSSESPSPCIVKLCTGLGKISVFQIGKKFPRFLDLFCKSRPTKLTRKKLIELLRPTFSEEGSNARIHENSVYKVFSNYIRDVASGRRNGISLGNILQLMKSPLLGLQFTHRFNLTQPHLPPNGRSFLWQTLAARL